MNISKIMIMLKNYYQKEQRVNIVPEEDLQNALVKRRRKNLNFKFNILQIKIIIIFYFYACIFILINKEVTYVKGVILAAGKGTRMYPLTKDIPKCMLPVAGKPIIEWGIQLLRDQLQIHDILIVVGYKKESIIDFFGDGSELDVNIEYVVQNIETVYGLGGALLLAQDFVNEDFVLLLGDNLYKGPFHKIYNHHIQNNNLATLHIEEVQDPTRYGVIVLEKGTDLIIQMIEKPKYPPSNLVITGFYVLNRTIFDILNILPLSERGELELTDAINQLVKSRRVKGVKIDGWRKDLGYPSDLLDASRWVLSENDENVFLSSIDESVNIYPPVFVGKNCIIKNSTLGPYATIGNNVKIINSRIVNSVILDNTIIENDTLIDTVKNPNESIEIEQKSEFD
ncbi:MAG: NTP transferase domain-containing protein [Candidatus Heimdallarchaeota archaeon]|nr:NTP transferase domain-containing protein [Candidatus Heimdallarchaeota archaeon]